MFDLNALRHNIISFANADPEYGWHDQIHKGKLYKFPKRALLWCVFGKNAAIQNELPEYRPFSQRNMKVINDCPFHSDVWIGAGFAPERAYPDDLKPNDTEALDAIHAFYKAKEAIEDEMQERFSFDFVILGNGLKTPYPFLSLFVYEALTPLPENTYSSIHILCQTAKSRNNGTLKAICLPEASVKYDLLSQNADVIIVETGGKLQHLSTVARERGKLVIRVDNACKKFPPFSTLSLNLNRLKITPN